MLRQASRVFTSSLATSATSASTSSARSAASRRFLPTSSSAAADAACARAAPRHHQQNLFRLSSRRLFSTSTTTTTTTTATSTTAAARRSVRKWIAMLVGSSALVGGSTFAYYEMVYKPRRDAPLAEMLVAMEEPEAFEHPYDSSPWFWRSYFAVKRVCFLLLVMTPCIAVSMILKVRPDDEEWRQYWLQVLVATIDRAGCSFQKLGQWLSMRPDMLPPDVIRALSTLRSEVNAHSMAHTRRMIREGLGAEIEDLFEEFDEEPVASGTIAQVHRAVLRPEHAVKAWTGKGEPIREVAVKVRHPQVLEEIWMDGDIIYRIINMTNVITIPFSKEEFLKLLQRQTDFKWEAYNLVQFAFNFRKEAHAGWVKFPEVSTSLLSSGVLVESWAPGNTVTSILSEVGEGFKAIGEAMDHFSESIVRKKKELAKTVFDLNMKMYLRDNLMHADMHAGNLLYDEVGNQCTVLDAGVTMSLDPAVRGDFGTFLHALCTGNAVVLADKMIDFHTGPSEPNKEALRAETIAIMNKWVAPCGSMSPTGEPISLGDILGEVCFSLQRNGIVLRGDIATVMMSMSISEGLIRSLDPDFDVVRSSLPYFVRFGTV